jgi:hypothetical protein
LYVCDIFYHIRKEFKTSIKTICPHGASLLLRQWHITTFDHPHVRFHEHGQKLSFQKKNDAPEMRYLSVVEKIN